MAEFEGFPKELVVFFNDLAKNNTKLWFNEHKRNYEQFVKKPCIDFVNAMGEKLETIVPGIHAIPKINQSLFKIHRDVRFSNDKRPFKTNMGLWFWEGVARRMECSGFYFHLEGNELMFGAGIYMFPKHLLENYREAVIHRKLGPELPDIIENLTGQGYNIGRKHYKKTPRGFDKTHANADLLLFNGLYSGVSMSIPDAFYSSDIVDLAFKHYHNMIPLHDWLNRAVVSG